MPLQICKYVPRGSSDRKVLGRSVRIYRCRFVCLGHGRSVRICRGRFVCLGNGRSAPADQYVHSAADVYKSAATNLYARATDDFYAYSAADLYEYSAGKAEQRGNCGIRLVN